MLSPKQFIWMPTMTHEPERQKGSLVTSQLLELTVISVFTPPPA